ncbi:GpE family phage tail protein [Actinobacillus equuli]
MASVFHWEPKAFEHMTLDELMQWREQARKRTEVEE